MAGLLLISSFSRVRFLGSLGQARCKENFKIDRWKNRRRDLQMLNRSVSLFTGLLSGAFGPGELFAQFVPLTELEILAKGVGGGLEVSWPS